VEMVPEVKKEMVSDDLPRMTAPTKRLMVTLVNVVKR
jgi:hypothetical protein